MNGASEHPATKETTEPNSILIPSLPLLPHVIPVPLSVDSRAGRRASARGQLRV